MFANDDPCKIAVQRWVPACPDSGPCCYWPDLGPCYYSKIRFQPGVSRRGWIVSSHAEDRSGNCKLNSDLRCSLCAALTEHFKACAAFTAISMLKLLTGTMAIYI